MSGDLTKICAGASIRVAGSFLETIGKMPPVPVLVELGEIQQKVKIDETTGLAQVTLSCKTNVACEYFVTEILGLSMANVKRLCCIGLNVVFEKRKNELEAKYTESFTAFLTPMRCGVSNFNLELKSADLQVTSQGLANMELQCKLTKELDVAASPPAPTTSSDGADNGRTANIAVSVAFEQQGDSVVSLSSHMTINGIEIIPEGKKNEIRKNFQQMAGRGLRFITFKHQKLLVWSILNMVFKQLATSDTSTKKELLAQTVPLIYMLRRGTYFELVRYVAIPFDALQLVEAEMPQDFSVRSLYPYWNCAHQLSTAYSNLQTLEAKRPGLEKRRATVLWFRRNTEAQNAVDADEIKKIRERIAKLHKWRSALTEMVPNTDARKDLRRNDAIIDKLREENINSSAELLSSEFLQPSLNFSKNRRETEQSRETLKIKISNNENNIQHLEWENTEIVKAVAESKARGHNAAVATLATVGASAVLAMGLRKWYQRHHAPAPVLMWHDPDNGWPPQRGEPWRASR